jgi:hypothetical protein
MQLRSMPWIRSALLTLGLSLVVAPAAFAHGKPARASAGARSAPSVVRSGSGGPKHKFGRGTSTNWSGYAVDGSSATNVVGTWTQPTAKCAAGENSWSSPWVGIDGDTSSTVEQTGTDSDCVNGSPSYYAWYEMYPKQVVVVPMTVHPGDSITGHVSYASGGFTLSLKDNTSRATYSTVQQSKKAKRSSVEWIMEGPSNGLLSNFGSVSFSGASATINNTTAALGSFAGANPITMVTSSGAARATPSGVSNGGSFSVAWDHS